MTLHDSAELKTRNLQTWYDNFEDGMSRFSRLTMDVLYTHTNLAKSSEDNEKSREML